MLARLAPVDGAERLVDNRQHQTGGRCLHVLCWDPGNTNLLVQAKHENRQSLVILAN